MINGPIARSALESIQKTVGTESDIYKKIYDVATRISKIDQVRMVWKKMPAS